MFAVTTANIQIIFVAPGISGLIQKSEHMSTFKNGTYLGCEELEGLKLESRLQNAVIVQWVNIWIILLLCVTLTAAWLSVVVVVVAGQCRVDMNHADSLQLCSLEKFLPAWQQNMQHCSNNRHRHSVRSAHGQVSNVVKYHVIQFVNSLPNQLTVTTAWHCYLPLVCGSLLGDLRSSLIWSDLGENRLAKQKLKVVGNTYMS